MPWLVVHRCQFSLGDLPSAKGADENVDPKRSYGHANQLAQRSARGVSPEFHLTPAILRLKAALSEKQAVHVCRVDVGHPVSVPQNLHRHLHTG